MTPATLPARSNSGSHNIARIFVPAAFGLAPLLTWLLTASQHGAAGTQDFFWLKAYAVPTLGAELATILLATCIREARVPIDISQPLRWTMLALGAFAIVSILWAPAPAYAAVRTLLWLIHLLFAAALARLCATGFVRPLEMMVGMAAGLAIVAPLTICFSPLVADPAHVDWSNGLPGFDHLRRIGYYAAPIGVIAAGQIAITYNSRRRFLWSAVLAMAVAFTAWSGSRGGVVAIAGTLVLGTTLFASMRRPVAIG